MKEKIYNYIKENPGCRQCEIASALRIWLCSKEFLNALSELRDEKKIGCSVFQDHANMEYYYKWYLVKSVE